MSDKKKKEAARMSVKAATATADRMYRNQLINAKSPALNALAAGEITRDEYLELTGEAVVETFKERLALAIDNECAQIENRVRAGVISPEEYQTITGREFPG